MTRRVLLSYLSLTLFVLIVLEIPLAVFFYEREQERFSRGVFTDASILATVYEDDLEEATTPDPAAAVDYAAEVGARVVLVDEDGISLVDTATPERRDFSTRPEIIDALAGSPNQGTRRSNTLSDELLYVAVPVASGGTVHGALRVTIPTRTVQHRVWRFWASLVGVAAVVLLTVGVVGWRLARSVTRPVRVLGQTAASFGAGRLEPQPIPDGAPDEIRLLGDALNTMADRLRRQLDQQRAFVADASHQLRTPLTALRLRLENLQGRLDGEDEADVEAALVEIERLGDLVAQLLQLARAEVAVTTVETDLVALVADRVETWEAAADANSVSLAATLPAGPVLALVSPGAIEQVLDNLIDNAVSMAPADTEVAVSVRRAGATVVISVLDHGPGLSDDDKARATTRFWRGGDDRVGSGLGLPIADALVAAHGGTLTLADTAGGGLTVTFDVPAADRAPAPLRTP